MATSSSGTGCALGLDFGTESVRAAVVEVRSGQVRAVDGLGFHLDEGETLGLVGESGCGKSVTAMSLLQLIAMPPGRLISGRADFQGRDLLRLSGPEMRKIRGDRVAMIFQEPLTSLNPVFSIGDQIGESLRLHQGLDRRAARNKAVELLSRVGLPAPARRVDDYPHQISGGMRQRVMIAMALACRPALLIADEPTTALDVTVQAQILELIRSLQEETGMSVLLITHDLGVIAETADRVVVMYCGRMVEEASAREIFAAPAHPYTQRLLAALPRLPDEGGGGRLSEIPGLVPSLSMVPPGCLFAPRCHLAEAVCATRTPRLVDVGPGHLSACGLATGCWQ